MVPVKFYSENSKQSSVLLGCTCKDYIAPVKKFKQTIH